MSTCQNCEGLIAEPGKAYSYAGKFCTCPKSRPYTLADLAKMQPGPIQVIPHEPQCVPVVNNWVPHTPEHFVIWMRGYIASCAVENQTKGDWKTIAEVLKLIVVGK
jgi:hypothetical protein